MGVVLSATMVLTAASAAPVADGHGPAAAVTTFDAVCYDLRSIGPAKKKAMQGDAGQAQRLSEHFLTCEGDKEAALYWMDIAAQNGDVSAMVSLARQYLCGGVEVKLKAHRGLFWLDRAVAAGSSEAKELRALIVDEDVWPHCRTSG